MRYLGIGIKLLSQNVFKTHCVDETSLFNLLWIQPLRWLLDIEVSWSFCHGRTAWWPLCWQEDPVPGSLVLWLICHHLQLKVTLAMKYLSFSSLYSCLLPLLRYLKRLIVDLGYKYRNCISQNKIIKFLIPLRRLFSKVNKWFMARVHLQTLQLQNTNVHLKLLLLLVRQGCSWKL